MQGGETPGTRASSGNRAAPLRVIRIHPCLLWVPLGLMLEADRGPDTPVVLVPTQKGVSAWKQGSLGMTTYAAEEVTSLRVCFPFKA